MSFKDTILKARRLGASDVHLESGTDLVERERSVAAKHQQHQHLVAGKGEAERAEDPVDLGQVDLLGPEHRGDRGHAVGRLGPTVHLPLPACFRDGIETQGAGGGHSYGG